MSKITNIVIASIILAIFLFSISLASILETSNSITTSSYTLTLPPDSNLFYKYDTSDYNITWKINSITKRNENYGKLTEYKISKIEKNSNDKVYINPFALSESVLQFQYNETDVIQIITFNKSELGNYSFLTIDETYTVEKNGILANDVKYYVPLNSSNVTSWEDKTKEIYAKEIYLGNKSLKLLQPKAWDNYGNNITGYYKIILSGTSTFKLESIFNKTDIDTLSDIISLDPSISNKPNYHSTRGNELFSNDISTNAAFEVSSKKVNGRLHLKPVNSNYHANDVTVRINKSILDDIPTSAEGIYLGTQIDDDGNLIKQQLIIIDPNSETVIITGVGFSEWIISGITGKLTCIATLSDGESCSFSDDLNITRIDLEVSNAHLNYIEN